MIIKINEGELEYTRPLLKKWLLLQDQQIKLSNSIKSHDKFNVAKHIVFIVSEALDIPIDIIKERSWLEVSMAYNIITFVNQPTYEFPFLTAKVKHKKESWDYDGRTWYIWSHMLAEEYGWTLETIANLDVDDAIALAQEIAVEDQLDKEWEWSISEIAYQSKDGFKPLERPEWMRYEKKEIIKTFRIRQEFMPVGVIIRDTTINT